MGGPGDGRTPGQRPGATHVLGSAAVVAALTALANLGWLGWDQQKYRVPGTNRIEGPYQSWQVIGLALTLVIVAAVAAWRGPARGTVVTTLTVTAVLTVVWSIDAATDKTPDANLWLVGSVFLAVGTLVGIAVVCTVVLLVRLVAKR